MTNMDLAAVLDSEIMRNYLAQEIKKEALKKIELPQEVNEEELVQAFSNFEQIIKSNELILFAFKKIQDKFTSDTEYAKSCDPLFVQAIMMLDLGEDK